MQLVQLEDVQLERRLAFVPVLIVSQTLRARQIGERSLRTVWGPCLLARGMPRTGTQTPSQSAVLEHVVLATMHRRESCRNCFHSGISIRMGNLCP